MSRACGLKTASFGRKGKKSVPKVHFFALKLKFVFFADICKCVFADLSWQKETKTWSNCNYNYFLLQQAFASVLASNGCLLFKCGLKEAAVHKMVNAEVICLVQTEQTGYQHRNDNVK